MGGAPVVAMSSRSYPHKRPRGFVTWRPHASTRELLEQVDAVLAEYAEHLPLTCRQMFYRLVGAYGFPKAEKASKRLQGHLVMARRSGRIPFESIRDDGATVNNAGGFHDMADFWRAVHQAAENYRRDRMDGQPRVVEVWVEAAGMVPQAARVAHEYGAAVYSSGGFDSLTVKHAAAQRIFARDRATVVLHVGDHDPSGLSVFDSAAEDVGAMVDGLEGPPVPAPEFVRVVVTPDQIARYQLPEAPPKKTDKRGDWKGGTVQAEALPPDVLAGELRAALDRWTDFNASDLAMGEEEEERDSLLDLVESGAEVIQEWTR